MRHDEWLGSGVEVFTADGQAQGRSVAAGRAAVAMKILTRSVNLAHVVASRHAVGRKQRL
jgi:hypothetical protein